MRKQIVSGREKVSNARQENVADIQDNIIKLCKTHSTTKYNSWPTEWYRIKKKKEKKKRGQRSPPAHNMVAGADLTVEDNIEGSMDAARHIGSSGFNG